MSFLKKLAESKSAFLIYFILLLLCTLTPNKDDSGPFNWLLSFPTIEMFVNLLLLAPLTFFLMLGFGFTMLPSIICAFVSTSVIEFFQFFIPGRVSDLRDVALNIFGAFVIGLLISRKTNTQLL